MRSALIFSFVASVILITALTGKSQVFFRHTDLVDAGLKGKVKSVITYECSLGDIEERCAVYKKKFNAQGFLVEQTDSTGDDFMSYKYYYNSEGLLTKLSFSASGPLPPWEETYRYSLKERKKITFRRNPERSFGSIDSTTTLYDKNWNEIEKIKHSSGDKTINKYDSHGFLISTKFIRTEESFEMSYINDDMGRVLKTTWSDERGPQTYIYDKNGNTIQVTTLNVGSKGNSLDYLTGYCEFDERGNYLKSITVCPQKKSMYMTRRVIEYY